MCSLGAFVETISVYKEDNVVEHLWSYGHKLKKEINQLSASHGLSNNFFIEGPSVALNYIVLDDKGSPSPALRTLFQQEMINNNVLMPWIAISKSHGNQELSQTLEACDNAFKILKIALSEGTEKYLIGDNVRAVFRKYN